MNDVSIPLCKCGNPTIIRHYKKSNMKPTSMGVCRECLIKRMKDRKPRRKGNPYKGKAHWPKPERAKKEDCKVILDFTQNLDIFNKIKEKAEKELRTIENQILYLLRTV